MELNSWVSKAPSIVSRKPQKPPENNSSQSYHQLEKLPDRPEPARVSTLARASFRILGSSSPAWGQCSQPLKVTSGQGPTTCFWPCHHLHISLQMTPLPHWGNSALTCLHSSVKPDGSPTTGLFSSSFWTWCPHSRSFTPEKDCNRLLKWYRTWSCSPSSWHLSPLGWRNLLWNYCIW